LSAKTGNFDAHIRDRTVVSWDRIAVMQDRIAVTRDASADEWDAIARQREGHAVLRELGVVVRDAIALIAPLSACRLSMSGGVFLASGFLLSVREGSS